MLNAYGFLSRIFAIFNTYRTPVDLVATSEVSVSMTIDNHTRLDEIIGELNALGQTKVVRDAGIVCLVGLKLWQDSAFIARVFTAMDGIPIHMVSLGSSDINLSLVIPEASIQEAIRTLHLRLLEN